MSVALPTRPVAASTSAMTWTPPKRPNANSAYSIIPNDTPNPYMVNKYRFIFCALNNVSCAKINYFAKIFRHS